MFRSTSQFLTGAALVCAATFAQAVPAMADRIEARVSIARQQMVVSVNGRVTHVWRVSTGRRGYATPRGSYRVQRMARMHYSRQYDDSPMPHSVFFYAGFAVHGTGYVSALGRPASHGCVRLAPGNAARLFNMIRRTGGARIIVS